MKKYIIGLFSAICLMGAGCTEFEDFEPVDMGEGPSVTVALEKTAVDAFNLTVTPAEGTVYYAYWVTNEAMSVDADNLLQAKYEGAELLKAAETASVSKSFTNQEIATTYYVYAVAADNNGLCGAIASATLELPDEEAPHLVSIPDGYLYQATNGGRSVTLTFNETVVRGEGAITYNVTKSDLTSYASGTIESVVINGESVIITLPETVAFDENEAKSYVFLDFAAGAFADAAGNLSAALAGGVDEETQVVGAPYWEYEPGSTPSGIVIEIDETANYGMYVFMGTPVVDQTYPLYADYLTIYPGERIEDFTADYGVSGFGSAYADESSRFSFFEGNISEDGQTFSVATSVGADGNMYFSCDVPLPDGSRAYIIFVVGTYDAETGRLSIKTDTSIPFTPDASEPLKLNTDKVIALLIASSTEIEGYLEIITDPYIMPYRLVQANASMAMRPFSLEPTINKVVKKHAIKKQFDAMKGLPVVSLFEK